MGWAAHNPEIYDQLIKQGIVAWIDSVLTRGDFQVSGTTLDAFEDFVDCIRETPETYSLYKELLHLASHHIIEEEKDYWANQMDRAKESR